MLKYKKLNLNNIYYGMLKQYSIYTVECGTLYVKYYLARNLRKYVRHFFIFRERHDNQKMRVRT
jgi:hypothetical protein